MRSLEVGLTGGGGEWSQMGQEFESDGAGRDGPLSAYASQDIVEPGAYVDPGSGRLYRVSAEDVSGEIHLPIPAENPAARYFRISRNPFVGSLQAREICRAYGIAVNF